MQRAGAARCCGSPRLGSRRRARSSGSAVRSATPGDAGGEGGVADRAGERWARCARPYLRDRGAAERAGDGRAVLGERGPPFIAGLEVGEGDARVLLLELRRAAGRAARPAGRGGGAVVDARSAEAVSTCDSAECAAHGTRVTARVPESTRTTGRTRARDRPIRRAAWVHASERSERVMIWRHLVTRSGDGSMPLFGWVLTYGLEMPGCAGVFVDTPGRRTATGPRTAAAAPVRSTQSDVDVLRRGQSLRRSPVEVENTWVSPGARHDVQRGALLRDLAAADADDQVLALAADLGGAVDVTVGAELLDDVDGDGETGRGVSVPWTATWRRAVASTTSKCSGRTPTVTVRVALVGGGGQRLALDRDDAVAELHAAVGDRAPRRGSWPGSR